MKITAFMAAIGACLTMTEAGNVKEPGSNSPTPMPTIAETSLETVLNFPTPAPLNPEHEKKRKESPKIAYDTVMPYEEIMTDMVTVKAAMSFKPQLNVAEGSCYPYPAVNTAGQVATGLHSASSPCGRPKLGSQVYGRSAWFGRVWAIMYAWAIPAVNSIDWEFVIVWTNNPNVTDQVVLGVSTSTDGNYAKLSAQVPPHAGKVDGKSVKVCYSKGVLGSTSQAGEKQKLVMWHQLTVPAQEALNNEASFPGSRVPINDHYFLLYLGQDWPFGQM